MTRAKKGAVIKGLSSVKVIDGFPVYFRLVTDCSREIVFNWAGLGGELHLVTDDNETIILGGFAKSDDFSMDTALLEYKAMVTGIIWVTQNYPRVTNLAILSDNQSAVQFFNKGKYKDTSVKEHVEYNKFVKMLKPAKAKFARLKAFDGSQQEVRGAHMRIEELKESIGKFNKKKKDKEQKVMKKEKK